MGPGLSRDRPFAGLRAFRFEDHEFFFGREAQIYSLYRILDRSRFISVVGSSGSGKSSLVSAGLLPLLRAESEGRGGRNWRFASMHPGTFPVRALATALSTISPDQSGDSELQEIRKERTEHLLRRSSFGLVHALEEMRELQGCTLLLVIDQFEELFRSPRSSGSSDPVAEARWRDESTQFVQLLVEAARRREGCRVYVLITMRSDFIGDCARFYGLPEAVSSAQFLVPSLTRDEREDVSRMPLARAGATIEPALVERLLNDAESEIDQLPVLQHTLLRLWECAAPVAPGEAARHLTLEKYQEIGTIENALSIHAEEVMASLPEAQLAIEQTFRALCELDKEGRATRRPLLFEQLLAETGMQRQTLLDVLDRFRSEDCSFVVPSPLSVPELLNDTRIDVVHEALLRRWERIGSTREKTTLGVELGTKTGWLESEADDGRFYRVLLAIAEMGSPENGALLPLDQVKARWEWWNSRPRTEAWARRYGGQLARVERLIEASRDALVADERRLEQIRLQERAAYERKIRAAARRESRRHMLPAAFQIAVFVISATVIVYAIMIARSDQQATTKIQAQSLELQRANDLVKQLSTDSLRKKGVNAKNPTDP